MLGSRGFGGPVTHLKLFSKKLVIDEKWVSEEEFNGLVSLASLLPGPTSSQVGMALGLESGGLVGALLFWLGFTLPSATLMYLLSLVHFGSIADNRLVFWILKLSIFLVVLNSVRQLRSRFAKNAIQMGIALCSFIFYLAFSNPYIQVLGLVISAILGSILIRSEAKNFSLVVHKISKHTALAIFGLAIVCIAISPLLIHDASLHLKPAGTFIQIGALAFGGGHVVLPLLQSRLLTTHLLSATTFARGYFLAQFMPGPLFAVAIFMGASSAMAIHGLIGGVQAVVGIYLPGSLLMISGSYFWKIWSRNSRFLSAIAGVNASVLGLLMVACINILRLHPASGA